MVHSLTDLGIEDNTIIIFTTDNGTNHTSIVNYEDGEYIEEEVYSSIFGMNIPGGKTKFNDWGVRVPMMVVWPGKVKPGRNLSPSTKLSEKGFKSDLFNRTIIDLKTMDLFNYHCN